MNRLRSPRARMPRTLLVFALACAAPQPGCIASRPFACDDNARCVVDGVQGICEASGACSFPDPSCPVSTRRFGSAAPSGLRDACVPAEESCIAAITAGEAHTCALATDGSAWCWGANAHGQLGNGTTGASATPTRVALPAGLALQALSAGIEHTCGIALEGTVWCWGSNEDGQLGVLDAGVKIPDATTPRQVASLANARQIAASGKHTCATATDGVLYCWGENGLGQVGDGTQEERPAPVKSKITAISRIAGGDEHTCALRADATLWCWGANSDGQLGLPETIGPVLEPELVPSITSIAETVAGDEHQCALKKDQTLWCWGYNGSGSIGTGAGGNAQTPRRVLPSASRVWSSGAAFHTCALTDPTTGSLACWGANDGGQIGNGAASKSEPLPVSPLLTSVSEVAVGGHHTCATTRDGALWCWGAGESGQLANGSTKLGSASPLRIPFCSRIGKK